MRLEDKCLLSCLFKHKFCLFEKYTNQSNIHYSDQIDIIKAQKVFFKYIFSNYHIFYASYMHMNIINTFRIVYQKVIIIILYINQISKIVNRKYLILLKEVPFRI